MIKKKFLWGTCLILSSIASTQVVNAKSWYPGAAPASYHIGGTLAGTNMISCSTCHSSSPETENNVTTSFGIAFGNFDDNVTLAYSTLAPLDSDGDGFSNQQEAFAGSQLNYKTSIPTISLADMTTADVSAKATVGGPVSALALQAGVPTTALGGTVSFESPASLGSTTTDFMFKAGGAQSGASVTFYDNAGTMIPANTADGAGGANITDGSVNIIVRDEGVFDLYSTAVFIKEATSRTPTFTPVASPELINPYAQVDPYAVVSPTATIDNYAVVDAYAIIDNYAVIGPYAQVGSYAYIAPNVDVYSVGTVASYAQISPYAQVSANVTTPGIVAAKDGTGYIAAKFSVTTTLPTPSLFGSSVTGDSDSDEDSNSTGGLHCMTTGLGTQGLMFLSLLGAVFLIRRKF